MDIKQKEESAVGVSLDEPEELSKNKERNMIRQSADRMQMQQRVVLGIYGVVVCLVFVCSVGALDGTQVAGLQSQIGQWMSGGGACGMRMEQEERLLRASRKSSANNNHYSNRMCLAAGSEVNLVVNYIDMDDGVGIPEDIVLKLMGPLERGRRIGGSVRVGRKNVVSKHISYMYDTKEKEDSLLECSSAECHLSMSGAFKVGWMVHDGLSLEYPENEDTLGLVMHLMVIDVSSILVGRGARLEFPMVGVLSKDARIALAVVDRTRPETLTSVVHEVDAWLYGEDLIVGAIEQERVSDAIVNSCRLEAATLLRQAWKVVEHGRHVRVGPTAMDSLEKAQQAYDSLTSSVLMQSMNNNGMSQDVMERSFRVWQLAYTALHSPDFGVEPRMPSMHVFALLMPFGLPIFFNFVQNAKFFIKKNKNLKERYY